MQLAKVIGFLFLAAVPTRPVLAEDWKIIQAEGRAYVSFANVAQFYRFPQFSQVSRTVSLRDERRGIRAQAGTNEFYINGVRFFSNFPLVARENENLISVIDIPKIVEPVLRPNRSGVQRELTQCYPIPRTAAKITELPGHGPSAGSSNSGISYK